MDILKALLKWIAKKVFILLPLKDHIILESYPDLSGNTYPLFEKMTNEKVNYNNKLIWFVTDKEMYRNISIENVYFEDIKPKKTIKKLVKIYLIATAKCIISENRIITKLNPKQLAIYLSHGTMIKNVKGKIILGENCDYCVFSGEYVRDLTSEMYHVERHKLVCLGYPRNDYLFSNINPIEKVFPDHNFERVIIWMPTFRQHNELKRVDSGSTFELGVPVLENINQLRKLNETLIKYRTLLVLKPHPAQDLNVIKAEDLSNFVLLYDEDLRNSKVHLYEFIGNTDALITDYSSVYFDYLLTRKPIGITIDDIEEYGNTLGFAYENIYEILKGKHINDFPDLLDFIYSIYSESDKYQIERESINNLMNKYQDNYSTDRVYEFIKSKGVF